jgi:hypothetical protein
MPGGSLDIGWDVAVVTEWSRRIDEPRDSGCCVGLLAHRGAAEPLADDLHVEAGGQEVAGVGVSQIVEAAPRECRPGRARSNAWDTLSAFHAAPVGTVNTSPESRQPAPMSTRCSSWQSGAGGAPQR